MRKSLIKNLKPVLVATLVCVSAPLTAFAEIVVDMGAPIDSNPSFTGAGPVTAQPVPAPITAIDPQTGLPILVPPAAAAQGAIDPSLQPMNAPMNADHFGAPAAPVAAIDLPTPAPQDNVASSQSAPTPAAETAPATKIDLSKVPQLYVQSPDSDADSSEQVAVAVKREKEPTCEDPEMLSAIFPITALNLKLDRTLNAKLESLAQMNRTDVIQAVDPELAAYLSKAKKAADKKMSPAEKKARLKKIRDEVQASLNIGRGSEDMEAIKASFHSVKPQMQKRVEKFIAFREDIRKQRINSDDRDHFPKAATSYVTSYRKEKTELESWAKSIDGLCIKYSVLHHKLKPATRTTASVSR